MNVKAIETHYKGYRFRSRLEARWAVFFDALGFEWEYEREGYKLPGGRQYLPDFYFPRFVIDKPAIIEIKPEIPSPDSPEAKKIMALTNALHPHTAVFVLAGNPDPERVVALFHIMRNNISGIALGHIDAVGHEQFCLIGFDMETGASQSLVCPDGIFAMPEDVDALCLGMSERIVHGLVKARQARFEFGENG
jgi:hypothetical protein